MNYTLNKIQAPEAQKNSATAAIKKLWPLMSGETKVLIPAFAAILLNSGLNLLAPLLAAHAIDKYIDGKNFHGLLVYSGILLAMYIAALGTSFAQTRLMGGVGQRVLFNLRNAVFAKLQELPVAFFNQNKAGDLISRINNDTDKLNQFFSQSLMQFIGSIFIMIGAGIFLLTINIRLGAATLLPAVLLLLFTQAISPWVKRRNAVSMRALGGLSAEIQESLDNFKVVVAFNRRDYFRTKFATANKENYKTSISAGIANNTLTPTYGLAANIGQLIVLSYGIYLISTGNFTIGLLIGFIAYVNNFYNPLRQLASLWSNFQQALAGWDRISEILSMNTDLVLIPVIESAAESPKSAVSANPEPAYLLEFKNLGFTYSEGKTVLENISIGLYRGKTYALVGPTGGGKTTTASLMARLYDPTAGIVMFNGRDLRTYTPDERTKKIGFILQEPFLFNGTVRQNILYGNAEYQSHSNEALEQVIKDAHLEKLLARFEKGLDTEIVGSGDAISLGQKQLVAFMRAILRNPEILILDEATANIDTITEQLLDEILKKLPAHTTRVIIAHRLNTIANADEIFFVNGGQVTEAGSMEHAVEMLLHGKRES